MIYDSSPNMLENTLSHNEKFGIYVSGRSGPVINHTIIAFTTAGPGLVCGGETNPIVSCSNIFGNSGGDFECAVGIRNFSMDPLFCEPVAGNYALRSDSPCAASNNECGALCGALPVTCDVTAVETMTWGNVKRIYGNR